MLQLLLNNINKIHRSYILTIQVQQYQQNPLSKYRSSIFRMLQTENNYDQQEAIQSLLELDTRENQVQDWKKNLQNEKVVKQKKNNYNFVQMNKKINAQIFVDQSQSNNDKVINLNRFKRANSLFDPIKAFKNISNSQMSYDQPLTPQPDLNSTRRKIALKNPQQNKDLNFRKSRADQICIGSYKDKSIQFIKGQSVLIQVQSYEQSYNKKEVEYLMSKTLASKQFSNEKSPSCTLIQIRTKNQQTKNKYSQNQVKKKVIRKNNFSLTSKMRYSPSSRQKNQQKQKNQVNSKRLSYSSLELKKKNDANEISKSIRYLLQSLSSKQQFDSEKKNISPNKMLNAYESNGYRNIDKQKILKIYEEEQMKKIKNLRQNFAQQIGQKLVISNKVFISPKKHPLILPYQRKKSFQISNRQKFKQQIINQHPSKNQRKQLNSNTQSVEKIYVYGRQKQSFKLYKKSPRRSNKLQLAEEDRNIFNIKKIA